MVKMYVNGFYIKFNSLAIWNVRTKPYCAQYSDNFSFISTENLMIKQSYHVVIKAKLNFHNTMPSLWFGTYFFYFDNFFQTIFSRKRNYDNVKKYWHKK